MYAKDSSPLMLWERERYRAGKKTNDYQGQGGER